MTMTTFALHRNGWRTARLIVGLLASAFCVACGGVAELDEEQVRVELTAMLEAYLPALGQAYLAGDTDLLIGMAVEKERATLNMQLEQNTDRGERLQPVLGQFTIDTVTLSRTTAFVNTTEVWDIDRLALGSNTVLQSYPNSRFRVQYQVKKNDGAWLVYYRQSEPLDD